MRESDVFPSKYLTGAEIDGREVPVVIGSVVQEEVGMDKDKLAVVYFQKHEKGVVLNKTNWRNLAYAYGDDSDDWAGQPAVLYTVIAHNPRTGEDGPSIRIKAPSTKKQQRVKHSPVMESENPAEGLSDEVPF
jgi:hypothetical protein